MQHQGGHRLLPVAVVNGFQVQVGEDVAVDRQKRPTPQNFRQSLQAAAGSQQLRLPADAEVKPPRPGQKLQHLLRQMMSIHRHLQEAVIFHPRQ